MGPIASAPQVERFERRVALGLGLVAMVVALSLPQSSMFGDGRDIALLVERGAVGYHHLLYFPVARLAAWVVAPFVERPSEQGPLLVAALAYGFAVGLTWLTLLRAGLARRLSLVGVAALATLPVAVFHATCVEVHGLQLAVAALATHWIVGRGVDGAQRAHAGSVALLWIGLAGTHLSGGLWAPALALVACRADGRWVWPRGVAWGVGLLGAAAGAWFWTNGQGSAGRGFVQAATRTVLLIDGDFSYFASQFVRPFGLLTVLGLAAGLFGALRLRRALPLHEAAALLLLVAFVPFGVSMHLDEKGGYFVSLAPVAVLLVVLWAARLQHALAGVAGGRAAGLPGLFLWFMVGLQLVWTRSMLLDWNVRYPGHEWVEPLARDLGADGWVLTRTYQEARTVFYHSRLDANPFDDGGTSDVPWESVREFVLALVERTAAAGGRGAILTTLWESERPVHRPLMAALEARFGRPEPGSAPGYLLFPATAPAADGAPDATR